MCLKVVIKLAQTLDREVHVLKSNTISIMCQIIKTHFLSNQGIILSIKNFDPGHIVLQAFW